MIDQSPSTGFNPSYSPSNQKADLDSYIKSLQQRGSNAVPILKKLTMISVENPAIEPASPVGGDFPGSPTPNSSIASLQGLPPTDVWSQDKSFSRLFGALITYLDPSRVCCASDLVSAIETDYTKTDRGRTRVRVDIALGAHEQPSTLRRRARE